MTEASQVRLRPVQGNFTYVGPGSLTQEVCLPIGSNGKGA